jgi:murein L,D-transpeptidase YafK
MSASRAIGPVLLVALWLAACPKPPPPAPATPPPAPPTAVETPPCKRAERLHVRKSDRALTVHCVGGGLLTFPIALARVSGPKRATGDQRMPEGEYRIAGPPRTSRFHVFIPFDYPSRADADRALAEKRIDAVTHAAITRAHAKRRMPPQDTPLGGALGLHGEGVRWRGDLKLNWTEGCIAVTDAAIEQISRLVRPGTPISIEP